MARNGVEFGEVVLMRGFKQVAVGRIVEATYTFKAQKNRDEYSVFVYLGEVAREELENFAADDRLRALGWSPNEPAAAPSPSSGQ